MKETTILLVLHFCCMLATVAALDCSKQENIAQEIAQCFTDQGLQLSLPECSNNSLFFPETWLMSTFVQHSSEICKKKEAYQNTITCIMDLITECADENHQANPEAGDFMALLVAVYCDENLKILNEMVQKQYVQIFQEEERRQKRKQPSTSKYWIGNW